MLAGPPAPSPDHYAAQWSSATAAVPSLLAMSRLNGATYTIRSTGPTEVPRACPICCWSAPRTTTPHTTPTGRSASHPTDSPNGSHHSTSTTNDDPADTIGTSVH